MVNNDSSQRALKTFSIYLSITDEDHYLSTSYSESSLQSTLQQQSSMNHDATQTGRCLSAQASTTTDMQSYSDSYFNLQVHQDWARKWWRETNDEDEEAQQNRENLPVGNCIRRGGWALEAGGTSVEEEEKAAESEHEGWKRKHQRRWWQ